jgi:hypothetical protein
MDNSALSGIESMSSKHAHVIEESSRTQNGFLVDVNERSCRIIISTLLIVCLSLLVVAILALSSVPPVSRDALTHHLYVPKLYLQHDGMYEIPGLEFSYYPMNLDLLFLIPLYLKNDIAPKFIHFGFALATATMIYCYLTRRLDKTYALLGSLFFLSIPVIIRLSSTVYVDLGLICFLFGSLLFFLRWIENGFKIKYLIISAVFCGLGLGTKYNGLIGLFLLGLFVPFVYARFHAGDRFHATKAIGFGAVFVMAALLIFSPWMIRNFIWTGNPIFPLYGSVFNHEPVSEKTMTGSILEKRSSMSHIKIRRQIYGESWWEIALIPLRVFFQGKDDDPKYFDGKTNPFLLLLPIFAFVGTKNQTRRENTEKMVMLFFSVLFFLFAFAQRDIRVRYFAPILPSLVILAMFGLHNIRTRLLGSVRRLSEGFKTIVVFMIIGGMLSLNSAYLIYRFKADQPMAYLTGKITRGDYIQKYRPEYASLLHANQHLSKNSRILGLFIGDRGYYSDIDISFEKEIIQQVAGKAFSAADILERLHERRFTHLLVNYSLFNLWVSQFSLHEKQMLKDFFDECVVTEFSKDGHGLLRLVDLT